MDTTTAAQEPAGGGDLSSRTVTTLVILTLVISFLGAWMNVNQASAIAASEGGQGESSSTAEVAFTIERPPRRARGVAA